MSTIIEQASLTRPVSLEECDDLITNAFAAFERGDEESGYSYLSQIPLMPSLATVALEHRGREYCMKHFNLSEANAKFGEGWMNE